MSKPSTTPTPLEKFPLSNKPTLVMTDRIRKQIDFLHKKVGNAEWSGELITREEGTLNDMDNWKIYAEEIFLADIGTSGFTGYEVDKGGFKAANIVEMYEQFPGLLDGSLKNHHIHSHHSMSTFFSGTDWSQLNDRSLVSNYFLMLITNHKNEHIAKVAFTATTNSPKKTTLKMVNNHDGFKDIELQNSAANELLVVMDCKVVLETPVIEVDAIFLARYNSVKEALEAEKKKEWKPIDKVGFDKQNRRGVDWRDTQGWGDTDLFGNKRDAFDSYKTKGEERKKISDMTDKEWEKFEQERFLQSDEAPEDAGLIITGDSVDYKKFSSMDVKKYLNAVLNDGAISFADPLLEISKIQKAINDSKDPSALAECILMFSFALGNTHEDLYGKGATAYHYISLLNSLKEYLAPIAKSSNLIKEMIVAVSDEMAENFHDAFLPSDRHLPFDDTIPFMD